MKLTDPQILDLNKRENLTRLYEMMDEAKVKQYLLDHPRFLVRNPELLSHIELKYGEQETFSLVERQVKTLRDKNSQLQGQQIEMLQTAHANEELLEMCNRFMFELLECSDLNSLSSRIVTDLKKMFDLDGVALVLVGDYDVGAPAQIFSSTEEISQLLDCHFPDNQPLCGRLGQAPKLALFGELSYNFQSCALVPMGKGCENGLLALASKDIARFDPEMGTLFIELIANYVSALVKPYERK
jgi:uncharacterized protein YigA (DUF484 family)